MEDRYRARPGQHAATRRTGTGSSDRLRPNMRLRELLDRWATGRRPAPKTRFSVKTAVGEFIELFGDKAIAEIRHGSMFDFRDCMMLVPRSRNDTDRRLGLDRLIALHEEGRDRRPRLAATTVAKKVNAIQQLMGFAYAERWIDVDDVHNIPLRKEAVLPRRPFTAEELTRLFAQPIFTRPWSRPERRHMVSDHTVRWLFLLGMTTGARIEELCQLTAHDVVKVQERWAIAITDCDDDGVSDQKHLKSPAARRIVPIHRRILDLGFCPMVERFRQSGEHRLFPELERDMFDRLGPRRAAAAPASSIACREIRGLCFIRCGTSSKTIAASTRLPTRSTIS